MAQVAKLAGIGALAVVFGSGVLGIAHAATAAVPDNSVTSAKIVNGAVRSVDIRNGAVASVDIADGAVGPADLGPGAVTAEHLGEGAIDGAHLADRTVTGTDLALDTVGSINLTDGGILSSDLADGGVRILDVEPALRPRWAHVEANPGARLINGRGVLGLQRFAPGFYVVRFDVPVTFCGFTAARTSTEALGSSPGFITASPGGVTFGASTVVVTTYDTEGQLTEPGPDTGFTVRVDC